MQETEVHADDISETPPKEQIRKQLCHEALDYNITYALIDCRLDSIGDDYVDVEGSWGSRDSLAVRDPEVRKIIN